MITSCWKRYSQDYDKNLEERVHVAGGALVLEAHIAGVLLAAQGDVS